MGPTDDDVVPNAYGGLTLFRVCGANAVQGHEPAIAE